MPWEMDNYASTKTTNTLVIMDMSSRTWINIESKQTQSTSYLKQHVCFDFSQICSTSVVIENLIIKTSI
jgi:hypothetical protein